MKGTKWINQIEWLFMIYLVSLVFFQRFYTQDSMFFWMLLAYIDFLYLLVMRPMTLFMNLLKPQGKDQDAYKRIRVYMGGVFAGIIVLAFTNLWLAILLMVNDLVISVVAQLLDQRRYKQKSK